MSWPIVGVAAILAASVAGALVALWVPLPEPSALSTPQPNTTVLVTERAFADERQAQLQVTTGPVRAVVSPRQGRLTSLSCRSGGRLESGSAFASIDGDRVVALATAVPLWRELRSGDRGEDVRALQAELARLGQPVRPDGIMGRETIRAAAAIRGAESNRAESPETVDPAHFSWIPEPEVTVGECSGIVGAPVAEGDVLVGLSVAVLSARLTTTPASAAPGARVVRVGSLEVPVDSDGAVTDARGLASIGSAPEFLSAAAGAGDDTAIPVQWSLTEPVTALVVPPSALWDVRDGSACVMPAEKSGSPLEVEVLGSELGQSFVRPAEGHPVKAVRTTPQTGRSCR
ncbi:peptidoglycan-binding protein [Leifsonia sp. EB34]|uniref:peptidoglycan-binding domain-containing protein n=1 Tax=Leifsonia sp. EB34 TaxID=3156303 RepID=UPI003513716B